MAVSQTFYATIRGCLSKTIIGGELASAPCSISNFRQEDDLKRPLKLLRKGAIYHVTARCYHDELRLTPGPAVNLFAKSTLIRAARRAGTPIYVAMVMGNHVELLVGESARGLNKFGEEFIKELSHRLNRMRGLEHSNFPIRYKSAEVGDPEAAEALIAEILCNPVRARLVYDADDWPGFSTLAAHRAGESGMTSPLPSRRDAATMDEAALDTSALEHLQTVQTTLEPPPFWTHLDEDEYHARICELVDAEQSRLQDEIKRKNERVVGPNRILMEPWHKRPNDVDWRPDRLCVSSDPSWEREFNEYYERETKRYKKAAKRWRRFGEWGDYPPGSFPPGWLQCLPKSDSIGPPLRWMSRKATGT
jgi:REP element-mobilizing transposase RayT